MDIQKINDFINVVNKDTLIPLWEQGISDKEIIEIMTERVWANWTMRASKETGIALLKVDKDYRPVKLTQELKEQLPWRLSNLLNIKAEFIFSKHLTTLGVPHFVGDVALDKQGVDVVIIGDYKDINVAVHKDTAFAWSSYARKYAGRDKCHYHFTFDDYNSIELEDVKNWLIDNHIYSDYIY